MMVPVDMRGIEEESNDVEEMVTKLGPKGAAEAFIKARDYFEAHKTDDEDTAKPMTAKEWSQVLEEDEFLDAEDDELWEDDFLPEGEEEDILEEPEEEEGEGDEDGEEGDGEPAAKKA